MRIALISTPFIAVPPSMYGGTELVVYELAEGLVTRGHEVELFATGDSQTSATLRSLFPTAIWPPEAYTDVDHVSWAMQHVVGRGFDVVHAHSAVSLACARLTPSLPLVYTIHHERDEQLSSLYAHCPEADYIAISEDQRQRETPLPNVAVIHHGLDPAKYRCAAGAQADYVCFVGRLSRVKGPHTAIDVAARAGVPIRIAGEVHPEDEAWAADELRDRLDQAHVQFLGPVGLADKVPLLCGARALLAPIEWNEPFGLIFIEAMLSGTPPVTFARGSVPEIVEHGVTGFIAESVEDMVEIVRSGGPLDAFDRVRCRERAVERFSRDRMVSDHLAVYDQVARAAKRRTRNRELKSA